MLGRHRIIASFRGICESRRRLSVTCIAGRVAQSLLVSNRLCLTKHERQNSIPYSVLVGRHVEINEMVPASSIGAGVDAEGLELSMVHDREPLSPVGAAPRFSETGDAHLEHVLTELFRLSCEGSRAGRCAGDRGLFVCCVASIIEPKHLCPHTFTHIHTRAHTLTHSHIQLTNKCTLAHTDTPHHKMCVPCFRL